MLKEAAWPVMAFCYTCLRAETPCPRAVVLLESRQQGDKRGSVEEMVGVQTQNSRLAWVFSRAGV